MPLASSGPGEGGGEEMRASPSQPSALSLATGPKQAWVAWLPYLASEPAEEGDSVGGPAPGLDPPPQLPYPEASALQTPRPCRPLASGPSSPHAALPNPLSLSRRGICQLWD